MKRLLLFLLLSIPAWAQGPTTGGQPFVKPRPAAEIAANVKDYGARGDGRASTHVDITASNPTLADTTDSPWTAADVGKTIVLYSQTYAGQVTTITGFTDSAHVVVAVAPTGTTTVNAVWGTDDSTAITNAFAAVTATGKVGHIHFPQGIYLVGSSLVKNNAQGLTISGAGAASGMSLGNYNVSGQPATGSALVWIGAVGGVVGCTGNTGAPPPGIANATTNCTAAENVMLKLSGGFHLRDLALIGSQRASHNIQIGGAEASSSFNWSLNRVNSSYARQYGWVIGGTGADQGSNFGEASLGNLMGGGNGIPNTTVPENDATGGGDIFVRMGNGNFQVALDTAFLGGGASVNGSHHVFGYSGNYLSFNNYYFGPLTSGVYSSVYAGVTGSAANHWTFTNCHDENGYMLHSVAGDYYDLRQVQMLKQTTTNPHVAAQFDNSVTANLDGVFTSGLPIVFAAGAKLSRSRVVAGPGSIPAYASTLCAGAGCITRVGSTVTFTTTATHPYLVGDWVSIQSVADATYNGVFKVIAPVAGTTFTVTNAAAAGASTEGGTASIAPGVIAETATAYLPQYSHPFVNYLENTSGITTAADLAGASTNLANKNAITMIPASTAGAIGASLPATIPAGWHFLDLRGSGVTFLGGPYQFGTAANPAVVNLFTGLKVAGAATTGTMLRGDGTQYVSSTNTWPNTTTTDQVLYATGANAIGSSANLTFNGSSLTVTGTVVATGSLRVQANGSDTFGAGPFSLLQNAAANRKWAWQLSASNNLDLWNDNGSGAVKVATIAAGSTVAGIIRREISATAVLDIGSVVTATCSGNTGASGDSADVTVTGAAVGDSVIVTAATALEAGAFLIGRVTAANTARFQLCNLSGAAVDRASDTYTIRVRK